MNGHLFSLVSITTFVSIWPNEPCHLFGIHCCQNCCCVCTLYPSLLCSVLLLKKFTPVTSCRRLAGVNRMIMKANRHENAIVNRLENGEHQAASCFSKILKRPECDNMGLQCAARTPSAVFSLYYMTGGHVCKLCMFSYMHACIHPLCSLS
jgi:hypothetical protein